MNYPPIVRVRRVDGLGRVVIPKEIREALQIQAGTSLTISMRESGELTITKVDEPKYEVRRTNKGEELVDTQTGIVVLSKNKITPQDIKNLEGLIL